MVPISTFLKVDCDLFVALLPAFCTCGVLFWKTISVITASMLNNGIANAEIPNDIVEISNGLPYRDFVTVGVLLDKINLKNNEKLYTKVKFCDIIEKTEK